MPRDGSGIYSQPFPNVVDGTTIESAVYNGFTTDVTTDLNTPRPVVAGGTGASSADQALFNLAGEKAAQVVTNYDSHVFLPGSFRSAAGATGAPNAHAFAGTVTIGEALANPPTNQNVVVEARDLGDTVSPGRKYVREKKAGTWGSWGEGVYAAPFDALAYNGMQINGSMEVSQERGITGTTVTATYVCDGWNFAKTGTMAVTATQSGIIASPFVSGFSRILVIGVSTAQPSLGASDLVYVMQGIEGYRMARLGWGMSAAVPITIGFWVQHIRTGTYTVGIRNNASNRSYVATYTQDVSNTWEYKTITVPGCTDGVWEVGNLAGIRLFFNMATGTTYHTATPNVWTNSSAIASAAQVNGVAATSDNFRLTGVVVLPGTQAPTAAQSPLIMRPYDQELLTCQRYFQQIELGQIAGGTVTTTVIFATIPFKSQMRAAPTLIPATGANTFYQAISNSTFTGTGMSLNFASTSGMEVQFSGFTGLTTGGGTCLWRASVGAIMVDARL